MTHGRSSPGSIALRSVTMPRVCPPPCRPTSADPGSQFCQYIIDHLSGVGKLFAQALLATGARPQELLNLRYRDVDQRGMVLIRALKKGRDRLVLFPPLLQLLPSSVPDPQQPIFRRYSYAKFYRSVKLLRPGNPTHPAVHAKVARLFRCAYASANHTLGAGDRSLTAQSMGHRSEDSTNFYIPKGGEVIG